MALLDDTFPILRGRADAPYVGGNVVTVHDTDADPNGPFRALQINSAGAVKVTTVDGSEIVFAAQAAGALLKVAVSRVWSTGTTVGTPNTNIVGLK
jgi:hypothetical protein